MKILCDAHLVTRLQPRELESCISITDSRLGDTSLGRSRTIASLRLPDLVLIVALRGATRLVDRLLQRVFAHPAVLPDPLPRRVHPPASLHGNLKYVSWIVW